MNDRATGNTQVTGASQLVTEYLTAYTSGNIAKALALVSADVSFRRQDQEAVGKQALSDLIGHVAPIARGMQMLHQWADGDDVCSVYLFDIDAPAGPVSLLVGEWNTVRNGEVASSLMAFDTGVFTSPPSSAAGIVDPVCGMTVDITSRAPHRSVGGRDYVFCGAVCAQRFDAEPDRFQAAVDAPGSVAGGDRS